MKRIIAIMLVLILVVSLVGCGKGKKRQPITLTLSTEDSEAIMRAAGVVLPDAETAAGANSTVRWLCWYDDFHNYSEDEIVQTGYWTFREKYHSDVEYMETTYEEFRDALAQHMLGGTPPDFTPTGIAQIFVFPMPCINGTYQPIDNWIDYDSKLWEGMKDASEYFALGEQHFAIIYDLTFKDVFPYNRRILSEWGFDDPYDLYMNDEWTWDEVYEMAVAFSDADEDRFAFDGWYVPMAVAEQSTGHYLIEKDENGHYHSNIDDPVIEKAEDMIYNWVKEDLFYREGTNYWANRNDAQYGAGVKDAKCLFWICDISGFRLPVDEMNNIWGDMSGEEFMFVPLPRHTGGDGTYYLSADPKGFMLVKNAQNPEGVCLLAACMRFKTIDPTVISVDEKQLRTTYLWTDEMIDMYKHCNELVEANTRIYNTGAIPQNLRDIYDRLDWNIRRSGASSTWAQLKEQNRDSMEFYCEQLNADIDAYIAGGPSA